MPGSDAMVVRQVIIAVSLVVWTVLMLVVIVLGWCAATDPHCDPSAPIRAWMPAVVAVAVAGLLWTLPFAVLAARRNTAWASALVVAVCLLSLAATLLTYLCPPVGDSSC